MIRIVLTKIKTKLSRSVCRFPLDYFTLLLETKVSHRFNASVREIDDELAGLLTLLIYEKVYGVYKFLNELVFPQPITEKVFQPRVRTFPPRDLKTTKARSVVDSICESPRVDNFQWGGGREYGKNF